MAQFHFVEDYERVVAHLVATKPIDEAMSLAVGGLFNEIGEMERDLLKWAGLEHGMSVVDLGCGSGRLAHALGESFDLDYVGIDIVQALLDYAATKSPSNYRFVLNRSLTIPCKDASADFVTAFSVFTHLLHSESFLYMQDIKRVLKVGGKLVLSFLEFANPAHWASFISEVESRRAGGNGHLNMLIERSVLKKWAAELGYSMIDDQDAQWGAKPFGQGVAIFTK